MIINKEEFIARYTEKFEMMHGKSLEEGTLFDKYAALAALVKDQIAMDWVKTNKAYEKKKQVYYFAMEFLPGRFLGINLAYRGLREIARMGLADLGINLEEVEELECDAGLGNGGLGRLGACFLDSLSSLGLGGHGCCLRYKYGLFKQKIVDGYQVELPDNWLVNGNIWEIRKQDKAVEVRFGGTVWTELQDGRIVFLQENFETVKAVPYDVPIVGYQNGVVNTLRLWKAEAVEECKNLSAITHEDYLKALEYKQNVEAISRILYPDDSNDKGKLLRLKQQYFLASAGLQSIIRHYKRKHGSLDSFKDYVAIHLNDTHPVLCIPEMMRILLDEEKMGWDEAWQITSGVMSYTNHTIMPEALESWPQEMLSTLLPRVYMIIEEIDKRLRQAYPYLTPIISGNRVQMANLAIAGSRKVNGVSQVHTRILMKHTMKPYYEVFPDKFCNMTNGVSHRRFLLHANYRLAELISAAIGPDWIYRPEQLQKLNTFSEDGTFLEKLQEIKRENKLTLAQWIKKKNGLLIDPDSIFDAQVKRIHAYKRQVLNVLHILDLYNRILNGEEQKLFPRTFIFGGKAAPGYYLAKKIIKLINTVAEKINKDPVCRDKLSVVFLENYNVSLAELIIPAVDVSEQLSTAGKEASGTGNMKFMMNGAVTIGTLDGANIEIRDAVGAENMVCFGLSVEEVFSYYLQGGYCSYDEYKRNPALRRVLEQLVDGFLPAAREEFREIYSSLLDDNDEFFVLKDFDSYAVAQGRINELYKNQKAWTKMCVANIANSGKFSSDRTIAEYARQIWRL